MSQIRYFAGSFTWVVIAKVSDAIVKFFSIPLMLKYFGKDNYGILILVISTNAYMDLLDLGINTGAIKYFSQWIGEKKYTLIQSASRTSMSFYLIIGIINSLILILLAIFGRHLFNVTQLQYGLLQKMFFILAFYCIINWSTSIFNQLLIADEKIQFLQYINIVKSVINFLLIFVTISFKFSLVTYFFLSLTINSMVLIPYYIKAKRSNLIKSFIPGIDWQSFKPILLYSIAIFAMGIFQFTATQSRPLVLGMFNTSGSIILTEYRIVEVFPLFIISIGGMIITILLPITSKFIILNQQDKIAEMAYKGTIFTSILILILCFPIIINSHDILTLYVGHEYAFLATWLNLWIFTIILYLHNSPVASLVLSTGKTKMLVYSSAIACVISIVINAALCKSVGVGSAVIGYFVYILIQMSFYYLYFNNKILNLKSFKVFKSFLVPTSIAVIACGPVYLIDTNSLTLFQTIIIKSTLWFAIFIAFLLIFKVINFKKISPYFRKL
jgi:O-antigen/teichoic acid export membrane protein